VARLPTGTRYAGVAAIGHTIYVAGGLTSSGPSSSVYAIDVDARTVKQVATLPVPEDHAALVALRGRLYLVGGTRVLRIDPASGRVSETARLPETLTDPAAVAVGGRIVILGGGTSAVYALRP
jgi:outer membrane protein assembly factor BamB